MNTRFFPLLAILSLPAGALGASDVSHIQLADKPRLVSCQDRPCFRLVVNLLDSENKPVGVPFTAEEAKRRIRVSEEGGKTHDVFHVGLQGGQSAGQPKPTYSMVLLDASGSMNQRLQNGQTRFNAAKEAVIDQYLSNLRPGVDHSAVATFESRRVRAGIRAAASAFSTSREELESRVRRFPRPPTSANTALYSAVFEALQVLSSYKKQGHDVSLIVLTDGKNDVRRTDDPGLLGPEGLDIVTREAEERGVEIHTIGFGTPGKDFDEAALRALAWPNEGNYYHAAQQIRLKQIFGAAREKLSNRFLLTVGPVRLDKNQLTGQRLRFRVSLEIPSGATVVSSNEPTWSSPGLVSPLFEDRLDTAEFNDLIKTPFDSGAVNPLLGRLYSRGLVLAIFGGILASLWFGLPRLVWPERYAPAPPVLNQAMAMRQAAMRIPNFNAPGGPNVGNTPAMNMAPMQMPQYPPPMQGFPQPQIRPDLAARPATEIRLPNPSFNTSFGKEVPQREEPRPAVVMPPDPKPEPPVRKPTDSTVFQPLDDQYRKK